MRYKTLGGTGLLVSEICLGTMTFGDAGFWRVIGTLGQDAADALVNRAFEAGVNFIDTANVYSEGHSEEITGKALKNSGKARGDYILATKFNGIAGKGPNDRGSSRGHIMTQVKESLRRLGTDYIDLYQVHAQDELTPVEETMRALEDLVRGGYVRYTGVSNWAAWRMAKAVTLADERHWARFATTQSYYSIAGRDLERDIIPMITEEKIGLMVWSPLAGGFLSGKYTRGNEGPAGSRRKDFDFPPINRERAYDCIEAMQKIGEAKGVSVARIALAWVLQRPFVMSVIVGAKTVEQLDDNLAATGVTFTPDELKTLDEVSALPAEYPGWMISRQMVGRPPQA